MMFLRINDQISCRISKCHLRSLSPVGISSPWLIYDLPHSPTQSRRPWLDRWLHLCFQHLILLQLRHVNAIRRTLVRIRCRRTSGPRSVFHDHTTSGPRSVFRRPSAWKRHRTPIRDRQLFLIDLSQLTSCSFYVTLKTCVFVRIFRRSSRILQGRVSNPSVRGTGGRASKVEHFPGILYFQI